MKRSKPPEEPPYAYKGDLRTASGELPRGSPCHNHWALGQGEPLWPFGQWGYGDRNLSYWTDYTITLIPLNNGKWQAHPIKGEALFGPAWSRQFDDRTTALRCAIAEVLRLVRQRTRVDPKTLPLLARDYRPTPALAQELVDWAFSLLGREKPAPRLWIPAPVPPPPPSPPRFVVGDRVVLAREVGWKAGRTGKVHRLCGEPFKDYCYVELDPRPRERTRKREMVEISKLDPDTSFEPDQQLSMF